MTREVRRRLAALRDGDDQEIITRIFWDKKHGIGLDYHAQLIRSMHATPALKVGADGYLKGEPGNNPVFVHHNGNGKQKFMEHDAHMYYKLQPELSKEFYSDVGPNHTIKIGVLRDDFRDLDAGGIKWKESSLEAICPKYVQQRKLEVFPKTKTKTLPPHLQKDYNVYKKR
jgi:hypothetical protein